MCPTLSFSDMLVKEADPLAEIQFTDECTIFTCFFYLRIVFTAFLTGGILLTTIEHFCKILVSQSSTMFA